VRVYACAYARVYDTASGRRAEWRTRGSKGGERFLVTIEPREMYYLFAVAPSAPRRARETSFLRREGTYGGNLVC